MAFGERAVSHPAANPSRAALLQLGIALACLAALALLVSGCALPRSRRSSKRAAIHSQELTNAEGRAVSMEVLEVEVMRFADTYAITVSQAVDDLLAKITSPEDRLEAVRWKLGQATAAYVDATGPNAALNALDLVVLASLSRMVLEDSISPLFGPAAQPLVQSHRQLETNAWAEAGRVLKPAQQKELTALIQEWRRSHPQQRYVAATRFSELAAVMGKTPSGAGSSRSSLLGLLYLDPFAGLDPTAQAIQESRQLAERAMYYGQRMPMLLTWQVQLLTLNLTAQPEAKKVLDDAGRLTRSTEAFAQLAAQAPKLVNDQRQAAIQQFFEGLATERTNWVASLASEQHTVRALLSDTRQTLDAATAMTASAQGTIKALDEFVRYVSSAQTNRAPAATNRPPFNVLDYGASAAQIGLAAKEINALLLTLNQSSPALTRQLTGSTRQVTYQFFWLGAALILILLVGLVLAGLVYHGLLRRWGRES